MFGSSSCWTDTVSSQLVLRGRFSAMRNDPTVLVFGEDVGPKGGVFLATEGLTAEFGKERGLRYSWGYPAIPDHTQHHLVFKLLPAREQLGMDVTEAGALVPELSTAAIVVHHPEAKYFSV